MGELYGALIVIQLCMMNFTLTDIKRELERKGE